MAGNEAKSEAGGQQWHYPDATAHPDAAVFIYEKWCKSCGICYSMCPHGVFTADKSGLPIVSNPEACTACGLCEILCPDMAITVYKDPPARSGGSGKSKR